MEGVTISASNAVFCLVLIAVGMSVSMRYIHSLLLQNELPQVGFEPATLYTLDRALYIPALQYMYTQ